MGGELRRMLVGGTHGSALLVTFMGVFLKKAILVESSEMRRVESSRSFATLIASLPVSF